MSLFGTSPEESPSQANPSRLSKSSLFDDEPSHSQTGSALFADDSPGGDSPWDMPTPKRSGRQNLAKSLLPTSDVPNSYTEAFDAINETIDRVGAGIGLTTVRQILSSSSLTAADQAKILNLVLPGGHETSDGLGRNEFNVLLALIGLAQEGEDLTFDAVDERRSSTFSWSIVYDPVSCYFLLTASRAASAKDIILGRLEKFKHKVCRSSTTTTTTRGRRASALRTAASYTSSQLLQCGIRPLGQPRRSPRTQPYLSSFQRTGA